MGGREGKVGRGNEGWREGKEVEGVKKRDGKKGWVGGGRGREEEKGGEGSRKRE